MDKSPEMCKRAKLNQEEIENMNRPIISKETESGRHLGASVVEHLLQIRSCSQAPGGSRPTSGSPHGASFSLCLYLCLSVSHEYINKGAATVENSLEGPREVKNRGSRGGSSVWHLPLAHVVILETRDRIPRRTHSAWIMLLPLLLSLPFSP